MIWLLIAFATLPFWGPIALLLWALWIKLTWSTWNIEQYRVYAGALSEFEELF